MYEPIRNERFIFHSESTTNSLFQVELAGYTNPDPTYISYQSDFSPEDTKMFQFEYVIDGVGYIEVNGYKYRVKKGDLFLLNKGGERLYYTDKDRLLEKKWITVYGSLVDTLVKEYNITDPVVISHNYDDVYFRKEFDYIETNPQISQSEVNERCAILVHRMIQALAAKPAFITSATENDPAFQIQKYLSQYIHRHFTLDDIAKKMFLSKNQVINIFKKKYHTTPMQYCISIRIENAKFMLRNSDVPISKISDSLAFTDNRHFAKTFKALVGMSPTEYRKQENEKDVSMD